MGGRKDRSPQCIRNLIKQNIKFCASTRQREVLAAAPKSRDLQTFPSRARSSGPTSQSILQRLLHFLLLLWIHLRARCKRSEAHFLVVEKLRTHSLSWGEGLLQACSRAWNYRTRGPKRAQTDYALELVPKSPSVCVNWPIFSSHGLMGLGFW